MPQGSSFNGGVAITAEMLTRIAGALGTTAQYWPICRTRSICEQFLTRVETSVPRIRALGITDYYSVDVYEEVLAQRKAGRLPEVDLIFPNVELRYGIGTGKGSPINFHLLVSPDDPEHVDQIRRFLRSLTFTAHGESYRCDGSDLIRLATPCRLMTSARCF
jgi:hypothetical protein